MMTADNMIADERTNNVVTFKDVDPWSDTGLERRFRCNVVLVKEEEGGYSASVLNLPGAISEGDTFDDAVANIKEAIQGVLEEYLESNEDIPWRNEADVEVPKNAILKRIYVNV